MGKFKEMTIDNTIPNTTKFIPRIIRGVRDGGTIERMAWSKSRWIFYWDEFRKMGFEVEEFE
jgi:hypothetical protein